MNQNLREDAMMEEAIASAEISMETPDTEGCCGEWTGKDSYDCDKDGARTKPFTCKCLCHIKTNTPDTEWRERLWEWVEVAPSGAEVLNCYPESVVAIIEEAISSCNAYWKEVVRKEVEGMRMTRIQWAGTTQEQKNALLAIFDAHNQALDALLDNLK